MCLYSDKLQFFLLQLYKMERQELLNIIKSLHNGDRIHVEYKPFFRSNYVIDTKFLGLRCDIVSEGGWLMHSRGNDYDSLIADMYDSLFRYFKLECAGSDGVSVIKIHLRRIKQLKIIG